MSEYGGRDVHVGDRSRHVRAVAIPRAAHEEEGPLLVGTNAAVLAEARELPPLEIGGDVPEPPHSELVRAVLGAQRYGGGHRTAGGQGDLGELRAHVELADPVLAPEEAAEI